MQTSTQTQTLKIGDKVYFGRSHGEQTLGTVLKVNAKSVMVRQDEARGTMRDYPVGTKWKVAPTLVRKVEGAVASPLIEGPMPRRPETEIMRDILGCYAGLSPENLTCDGEIRGAALRFRANALRTRLNRLFIELGRQVTETEAYRANGY